MNASALDLAALWDFSRPAVTEERLRAALATAGGDDVLILQTQIARTHGLRRDFDTARRLLREAEPARDAAGPEAQVRWWLEWGRAWASAAHPAEAMTPEARERARAAWTSALGIARGAQLDALAIDAVHMFAFIDSAPEQQLKWADEALALALGSQQPAARRWEASVRNNRGLALHGLGRLDEALAEFQRLLALRERAGDARQVRVAHWMVAWTLRGLGRFDEALAIQHRLEREFEAAGETDPYVFEELAALYRVRGDNARAEAYEARRRAAGAS